MSMKDSTSGVTPSPESPASSISAGSSPAAHSSAANIFWMGYALAGLGAVLFSAKAIVVKLTYRYGVDALTIIGFRMMLSLPFYAAIAWYQARQARQGLLPVLTRRERLQIVFLGFIGYYLSSFLDFLGLQNISGAWNA